MTLLDQTRPFTVGTQGWSVDDLSDPAIAPLWNAERFELIEGVLSTMSPPAFSGGAALLDLVVLVRTAAETLMPGSRMAMEPELVIRPELLLRPDACLLSADDLTRQRAAKPADTRLTRLVIPPHLVIEAVSPGHESHDRLHKRRWYAEFGVRHYWILDPVARRLDCFTLSDSRDYTPDTAGDATAILSPAAVPGLTLDLSRIWL